MCFASLSLFFAWIGQGSDSAVYSSAFSVLVCDTDIFNLILYFLCCTVYYGYFNMLGTLGLLSAEQICHNKCGCYRIFTLLPH